MQCKIPCSVMPCCWCCCAWKKTPTYFCNTARRNHNCLRCSILSGINQMYFFEKVFSNGRKWFRREGEKNNNTLFPVILPYPDFYRTHKHKRLSASSVSSRGHRRPSHRISRNAALSANFKVSHFSLRALLMKTHLQWFLLIIVMLRRSYRGHLDSVSWWTSPFKPPSPPPSISSSSALFSF